MHFLYCYPQRQRRTSTGASKSGIPTAKLAVGAQISSLSMNVYNNISQENRPNLSPRTGEEDISLFCLYQHIYPSVMALSMFQRSSREPMMGISASSLDNNVDM